MKDKLNFLGLEDRVKSLYVPKPNPNYDVYQTYSIRKYLSKEITPNYKLNISVSGLESLKDIFDNLQKIPSFFHKICNSFGGTVLVFDGQLTDDSRLKSLKGICPEFYSKSGIK